MYQFILLIHIFIAASLILLVLIQQGKGATVGAAFGAGASQTVFGSRGSGSFLLKLTIGFVVIFFATSLALNNMASKAVKQQPDLQLPMPVQQTTGQPSVTLPVPSSIPQSK